MSRIKYLQPHEILEELSGYIDFSSQRVINQRCCIDVSCPTCGKIRIYAVTEIRHRGHKFTGLCSKCNGRSAIGRFRKHLTPEEVESELHQYIGFGDQRLYKGNISVLVTCKSCKKKRLVPASRIRYTKDEFTTLCKPCHDQGQKTGSNPDRYKLTYIKEGDPRRSWLKSMLSRDKTIATHRLVMAEKAGRALKSWEHVHHINGDKHDNRPENLELITVNAHMSLTHARRIIDSLRQENEQLKRKIANMEEN